jgi:hypothetical protein
MVMLTKNQWPADNDDMKLIQLFRRLKPQSTSREIDDEEPVTYDHNRLYLESEQ